MKPIGDQQHDSLDEFWIVAPQHRIDDEAPDAGSARRRTRDDGAADQGAELQPEYP